MTIKFDTLEIQGEDVYQEFCEMISKSSRQNMEQLTQSFAGDVVEPPLPIFDLAHLVVNSTWHARCVEIKAAVATSQGWMVNAINEAGEDNQTSTEAIINILDAGAKSEATSNLEELLKALAVDMESLGNAYIEIVRDLKGRPVEFYHVPALTVRRRKGGGYWQLASLSRNIGETAFQTETLPRTTTQSFQLFGGALYSKIYFKEFGDRRQYDAEGNERSGLAQEDQANEIIHIKRYHPLSPLYGIPSFIAAFSAMVGDEAAEKWNLQFFENNRVPRWLIQIIGDDLTQEEKDAFSVYFSQILKGRPHTPMLLTISNPDAKIVCTPLEVNVNEGSFLAYRDKNRDEIIVAHGVPPRMCNIITPGQLGGQGDGQTQRENFRDFTIIPLQKLLVGWLNEYVLPAHGFQDYEIRLKCFDAQSAEEQEKRAITFTKLFERGICNINESRAALGLDPIQEDWANEHFLLQGENFMRLSADTVADSHLRTVEDEDLRGKIDQAKRELESRFASSN